MNLAPTRFDASSHSIPRSRARTSHGLVILEGIPTSPSSAREALSCLTLLGARLRAAGDPRAAFADVYAIITRRVCEALEGSSAPLFEEPCFISQLAGRFCALYLAVMRRSLAREPEPIAAWSMADRRSTSRWTLPVQHALLGLNAHINYDLALGLRATVSALGGADDPEKMARYRHDHDAVNGILDAAVPEALELLAVRHGCPASRFLLAARTEVRRAASRAALFALEVWRSRAWNDSLALLAAGTPRRAVRVEARMNLRAGLVARLLGLPLPAL
jgi:hypothetical protein